VFDAEAHSGGPQLAAEFLQQVEMVDRSRLGHLKPDQLGGER
jgi:hypothetical protein